MRQEKALQPHEMRAIRIDKNAILHLLWKILRKIGYEKFNLSQGINSTDEICVDWYFDEERCEIDLFAYNVSDLVDREIVIAYVKSLTEEALDSILVNVKGKTLYQSIKATSFLMGSPGENRLTDCSCKLRNLQGKVRSVIDKYVRTLRKHELRLIRLSQQALQELLWELFMQIGDEIMDIPEEDSFQVLFHMSVEGKLEEVFLYALKLREVSQMDFEKVDAYCKQNVRFTRDLATKEILNERYYTTMIVSKSCIREQ